MSDDTGMSGVAPVSTETTASKPGFLASTTGKAIVIGGAVLALLVILGVVIYIVLGQALLGTPGGGLTGSLPATQTVPAPSGNASSTVTTAAVVPVADVDNRDIFTPRDPFHPIAAPRIAGTGSSDSESSGSGGSSTTTSTSGTAGDNALVLDDIVTENGVRKAVLTLNGTRYTVAAGQRVGTSPWKVISIGRSSVVLLFGDSRVTLSLGQGISK